MIGDRRKYLTALVTLDPDNIAEYAQKNSISFGSVDDLIGNEKITALIEEEVAEKNRTFASFETIKKVTIIPEFTIENGLLTPTLKIKKNVAMEKYQDKIDAMYPKE